MKQVLAVLLLALTPGVAVCAETASASQSEAEKASSAPAPKMPATLMFTTDELNDIQGRIATGDQSAAGARGGSIGSVAGA